MSKLGGEFAVLVLITGDQSQLNEIKSSARELETVLGVTCFFKDTLAEAEATSGVCYQLEASGFDRVGIVESISAVLATRHVNVTSFASRLGNAPHTGTQMFFLSAELRLPEGAKLAELETELSDVCEKEGLEYILQEA